MKLAYLAFSDKGYKLARDLAAETGGQAFMSGQQDLHEWTREHFAADDGLVFVGAAGIAVRAIAPCVKDKTTDPAVVVIDERGLNVIPILSGHLGGANDLAREMAGISGGTPVITTATDVAGELSFDSFAKKYGMAIENIGTLKHISGALLRGEAVRVFTDRNYPDLEGRKLLRIIPVRDLLTNKENLPAVVIHEGAVLPGPAESPVLYLRPRTICAGIGCKRGMPAQAIKDALLNTLREEGLSPLSLSCLSTIPLKADEAGIIETARSLQVDIKIIPTEDIKSLDITSLGIASSEFVAENPGVPSVSTASAYLASGRGSILRDKAKYKGITIALARMASIF